ncbi:MAG TPA: hypothetical protein VEX41_08805 [Candidatus Eisenbacteria bacterium]|nr:hypothetical protein [Candidatus Eisenbacteria bacterium]
MVDDGFTVRIELTAADLQLVGTALEVLEETLGHDEAEELAEVKALLARLPKVGPHE